MTKLDKIQDARIAFNGSLPLGNRWEALQRLRQEVLFKLQKLEELSIRYSDMSEGFQQKALKKFKEMLMIRFMEKYSPEIKSKAFSKKMMIDFDKLEKMEKLGCYHFIGIKVIKEDCGMCNRRCSVKGDIDEQEED